MKNYYVPVLATIVISLSACATIKDRVRGIGVDDAYKNLDINGDGTLSRREANRSPSMARNFTRLDTNQDGILSDREYAAATTNLAKIDFGHMDINKDGVISEKEAKAAPVSLDDAFDQVDSDQDGNVSPVEYAAAQTNLMRDIKFNEVDLDEDGVISEGEAANVPFLYDAFDSIDIDDDDQLSKSEFSAMQTR